VERLSLESGRRTRFEEDRMRNATSTIVALALIGSLPAAAAALETLPNGKFDTGIGTWSWCCGPSGTFTFDPTRDASGSDLSGSAVLTHTEPVGEDNTYLFLAHCISGPEVQGGKAFFLGAKVRFREGETSTGMAFLSVEFRPDAACEQASITGATDVVEPGDARRGAWLRTKIGGPAAGVVLPEGTNSMRVAVVTTKYAGSKLTVNVDDFFAAPVGTPVCDGLPATLAGTAANELLAGTNASDVIVGRGGKDWIDGKGGNDRLCGGAGADVLYGGYGDDRLFGEGGSDDLYGAQDDDLLEGGGGNDDLYGDAGADKMKGGSGADHCDGGSGTGDGASGCETVFAVP
jgi:hypothetical protein